MTTALLAASGSDDPGVDRAFSAELRAPARTEASRPLGGVPLVMIGIVAASLLIHAALVLTAFVGTRTAPVVPREIAVEIVQEAPPAQAPPPKAAKQSDPKPAAPERPAAKPPAPSAEEAQLAAMQKELAALRAEHAALKSEVPPPAPAPAVPDSAGRALAFPSIGGGEDGEVYGFQQLVFSQLAKAKGDGGYRGKAGIVGLRFEMDATGKLLGVTVTRTSGDRELDDRAVDIVRRAAPFPPPPTEAERIVTADVTFRPGQR